MSLADATYRLCADIEHYREARRAQERWSAFNTPETMIDIFESW